VRNERQAEEIMRAATLKLTDDEIAEVEGSALLAPQ
jgi:aryl-alcohol dehydrogenase-like predicted oxidoreductase